MLSIVINSSYLMSGMFFRMVSFRGKMKLEPHPDWSPLGVKIKFSDEHPRPFQMGVSFPPPPPGLIPTMLTIAVAVIFFFK